MKIPQSLRRVFQKQKEDAEKLKVKVDERLRALKNTRWHYVSRLKGVDSFTLKVESGKVLEPLQLEDFFACTLVVANATEISIAEDLVTREFHVVERRPRAPDRTHKRPEAFPFDDLRLFVKWRDDATLPPTGLTGLVFEVQVKTFLQHAWSIATHSLIYKTPKPDWPQQRIAYQIKAMLEHAELSIAHAEELANDPALHISTNESEQVAEIIEVLHLHWTPERLPTDLRRLAENLLAICRAIKLNSTELGQLIARETEKGRGANILNLSTYGAIVDVLIRNREAEMLNLMKRQPSNNKPRVFLCAEAFLPVSFKHEELTNTVILS